MFGYTCLIDVSARGEGRRTWKAGSWLGKSFDTFAPIGPCIATADEIPEPNDLVVRFWNDGQLRHNYNTDDMEHRVPELVEFASTIMTLNTGDLIACGTNHEGLGALQDGETVEIEIERIGRYVAEGRRPAKAQLGARDLYGRQLDQPRGGQAPPAANRGVSTPPSTPSLPFDVNSIAFDPHLVDRYIGRHWPVDQFSGAHVELRKMQRALDQAADQLAARQRRVSMSADIAQRIKGAVDIGEHDTLAIDRDKFHFARRQITGPADGDKAF